MATFKDATRSAGYSQEELYFHKLNQELIEKMRQKGQKKKGHLTLVHSADDREASPSTEEEASSMGIKKAA
jgi:hypothetical protein